MRGALDLRLEEPEMSLSSFAYQIAGGASRNWSLFLGLYNGAAAAAESLQSCPTLCDPIDSSPPGSPVPGILQARTLEWVAIAFSGTMERAV